MYILTHTHLSWSHVMINYSLHWYESLPYIAIYLGIAVGTAQTKYGKGERRPLTTYPGYGIWECIHVFGEEWRPGRPIYSFVAGIPSSVSNMQPFGVFLTDMLQIVAGIPRRVMRDYPVESFNMTLSPSLMFQIHLSLSPCSVNQVILTKGVICCASGSWMEVVEVCQYRRN